MSKKIRNSNVALLSAPSSVSAVEEIVSEVSEVSEVVTPTETNEAETTVPVTALSPKDAYGFGRGTETAFILAGLLSGSYSRKGLEAAFLARFVPDASPEETKRKKTTFSVFLSDVKRPIGTYHASRGLSIEADASGILSVTTDSSDAATRAISGGILTALKGLSPKKYGPYARVLGEFGLTPEPKK